MEGDASAVFPMGNDNPFSALCRSHTGTKDPDLNLKEMEAD